MSVRWRAPRVGTEQIDGLGLKLPLQPFHGGVQQPGWNGLHGEQSITPSVKVRSGILALLIQPPNEQAVKIVGGTVTLLPAVRLGLEAKTIQTGIMCLFLSRFNGNAP